MCHQAAALLPLFLFPCSFKVEAYDDVGAAASSSDLLQDDVLVMVQGSLYVVGMLPEVKVSSMHTAALLPGSLKTLLQVVS